MPRLAPAQLEVFDDDDYELDAIHVQADPNGLAYDRYAEVLYVADGNTGAILRIDGDRRHRVATIESGGVISPDRIGGLAVTPYGTLYASRFGWGQAGAVFAIEPDGQPEPLDRIPPRFWRLGLTYDPHEHVLYTTQFLKSKAGPCEGSVLEIDLADGFVSTVIDGFVKPVGVVKLGSTMLVSDARQRAVFRVELADGRAVACSPLAGDLDRPDSMCTCSPDSVLVTCYDEVAHRGSVCQLWLDGRTREIASGPWEPRGVATDGGRVFVAARRAGRVLVFSL